MNRTNPKTSLGTRCLMACAAIVCFAILSGCGFFCRIPKDPQGVGAGDRCYIENEQFIVADKLYAQLGSLLLVERHLCEVEQWKTCETNEALYRLRKVHGLP